MANNENYASLRAKLPEPVLEVIQKIKDKMDSRIVGTDEIAPGAVDYEKILLDHGFVMGPFSFIFMREQHPDGEYLHLSCANRERYPSWDELMIFRAAFFEDDMEVFMVMPPIEEYVNVHENCFHLWHKKTGKIILAR